MILEQTSSAQQGGEGRRPPLPFFENRKKCPNFGKKGPNGVHLWVKSSIQNVVLRVYRTKSFRIFPTGSFFLGFIQVP